MKTEFYWKFIAFVLTIMLPQDGSGEKVWEIPFDKAKVHYHRSGECITIKGETHCTSKNKDEDYNGLFMEAIDVDNQGKVVDLLIAKNCNKIVNCRDKSVKTIIVSTDVVHDCIGDITRALSDHGTVIVVGKDKAATDVVISRIHELTDLCFDKHYDLPENVRHVASIIYDNSDLEIKAFVTSATLLEQLHALISDQKYKEAVDMIKYLQNINKKIIRKLCAQLPQKGNGYKLMDFIYKLVKNNEKAIINDFPLVFQWIFNGDTVRLLDKERRRRMADDSNYLVYNECGETDRNTLYKFNPVWDTNLNSVVFSIEDIVMRKTSVIVCPFFYTINNIKHRRTFAYWTNNTYYDLSTWLLKPGLNENGELAFCFVNVETKVYLSQGSCGSYLIGIESTCTPDMGWIIDNPKPK